MSKVKFTPSKYLAKCCGDIIQSKYSGQFVSCKCGKCFVDQTEYYTRGGGEHLEIIEEKEKFGEDKED